MYSAALSISLHVVVGTIKDAEIWLSDEARSDLDGLGASRFEDLHWERHDNVHLKGFKGASRLWSLALKSSHADPIRSPEPGPGRATVGAITTRSGIVNIARVSNFMLQRKTMIASILSRRQRW
jgi:hypothetical protein